MCEASNIRNTVKIREKSVRGGGAKKSIIFKLVLPCAMSTYELQVSLIVLR